jgi:hypothetical protein
LLKNGLHLINRVDFAEDIVHDFADVEIGLCPVRLGIQIAQELLAQVALLKIKIGRIGNNGHMRWKTGCIHPTGIVLFFGTFPFCGVLSGLINIILLSVCGFIIFAPQKLTK